MAAKQAGQAEISSQANGFNTARILRDKKSGKIVGAESGFGPNIRKYSASELSWIMGRGASGGSLSRSAQAVYDRMMYLRQQQASDEQEEFNYQKELSRAHAEDERKRKLDAAEWDRQNRVRFDQAKAVRYDEDLNRRMAERRANEEYDRRTKAKQEQEQAKLDAENARYEALNRKYGIAEGTRLSNEDYNNLEAGRSKWGYSRTDQQAIDTINNDMDEVRRSGRFTPKELAKAEEEAKAKIGGFQKRLLPNDQPPTAEQIYNSAIDAPDGTKLISNGSGGLVAIPGTGPQKEVETPSQKQANALEKERRAYVLTQIEAARKNWNNVDEKIPDPRGEKPLGIPNPNFNKPFNPAEAIKVANENWSSAVGVPPSAPSVPTPNPQGGGATPAPATDLKKKWAQYAD